MKTIRKSPLMAWVLTLAVAVSINLGTPIPTQAQAVTPFSTMATPVSRVNSAISNYVPVLIKYVGTQASATAEVSAGGDLTLKHGAASAEVADTTFECDNSIAATGSRNGIADLSTPHANCDTYGELVDIINDSPNWKAVLLDAMRSDLTDNTLITLAATSAMGVDGLGLLGDGTTSFIDSIALVPLSMRKIGAYINLGSGANSKLKPDPYAGYIPTFFYSNATSTYGSGNSTYGIYCVRATYDPTNNNGYETVEVSSTGWANGATTVLQEHTRFSTWGLQCPRNTKMIARVTNSLAMTAVVHTAYGKLFPVPTH